MVLSFDREFYIWRHLIGVVVVVSDLFSTICVLQACMMKKQSFGSFFEQLLHYFFWYSWLSQYHSIDISSVLKCCRVGIKTIEFSTMLAEIVFYCIIIDHCWKDRCSRMIVYHEGTNFSKKPMIDDLISSWHSDDISDFWDWTFFCQLWNHCWTAWSFCKRMSLDSLTVLRSLNTSIRTDVFFNNSMTPSSA